MVFSIPIPVFEWLRFRQRPDVQDVILAAMQASESLWTQQSPRSGEAFSVMLELAAKKSISFCLLQRNWKNPPFQPSMLWNMKFDSPGFPQMENMTIRYIHFPAWMKTRNRTRHIFLGELKTASPGEAIWSESRNTGRPLPELPEEQGCVWYKIKKMLRQGTQRAGEHPRADV